MLNFPDRIPVALKDEIFGADEAMGGDLKAGKPDAPLMLSNDHLHNFFLDNFPACCIGCAESHESPIEHFLHAKRRTFARDQALGSYLLESALQAGFDPSFSMEMVLDHGSRTALELAGVDPALPIVPVLINCVQPPMPAIKRSYDLGLGADGIFSQTRDIAFPGLPAPHYVGQICWRLMSKRHPRIERRTYFLGGPMKVGMNPVSPDSMYMFLLEPVTQFTRLPDDLLHLHLGDLMAASWPMCAPPLARSPTSWRGRSKPSSCRSHGTAMASC